MRRICVVTGSRADYGLLYWLLREIEADDDLALQLVVTGTHLIGRFGDTVRNIEDDGFAIAAKVPVPLDDDSAVAVAEAIAAGTAGMARALAALKPDIVVAQGDRFEMLAAVQAALVSGIPVAHVHGGEVTEGAFDDAIRHAITKMSHLHFAAAEAYRQRIIQMGEAPGRVFTVGAPGLDNIEKLDLPDRAELGSEIGIPLEGDYFLVTYHPATASGDDAGTKAAQVTAALSRFPDHGVLITGVNADPGHDAVARTLDDFARANGARVSLHRSLGQRRYLGAMKYCAAVIGNSSSGIIEAPALKVPTVNVGPRQAGRLRAASVIDCDENTAAIAAAIEVALDPSFREKADDPAPPYGGPGASARIKAHLKSADLGGIVMKKFNDLPTGQIHG